MSSKTKVLVLASVMLIIAGFILSFPQICNGVRTVASAVWGA
jgi:hypothetical protein